MKSTIKILFLMVFVLANVASFAQGPKPQDDPKYGDTPEERKKNLEEISLYSEYAKQGNYKDALPHWRYIFNNRPQAFVGIHQTGEKILKKMMKIDKANKGAYVDTIIMVLDSRMEHFPDGGKTLGNKGVYLFRYKPSKLEEAYKCLSSSMKESGAKASAATASTFMQASAKMLKSDKLDASQVVEDFGMCMDIVEPAVEKARIKAAKKGDARSQKIYDAYKKALKNVEILFVNSGAADCDKLIAFFTPKFEENKEDLKLLKKITKYLDDQGCDDSELFGLAAEQRFKLEPTARAAYALAKRFMKQEEMDKAVEYYNKAIEQEKASEFPDADFMAKCSYQKAVALYVQKKFSAARTSANEAAKLRANWGKPYILIARLYAASGTMCKDKIDQSAVNWAAVDKLHKAKKVDPEVTDEANKLIGQYSKRFPNKEAAFFLGITNGSAYKVGCWINESTKARF